MGIYLAAKGLESLDGGYDNPHPPIRLPGNTVNDYCKLLKAGDHKTLRENMREQDEYNAKMAPQKAIAAISALSIPAGIGAAKAVDTALNAYR